MKPILLTSILTLLSAPLWAADTSSSTSTTVTLKPDGKSKATVVIDVNGKKEVREIDLGNGTEVKVGNGNHVTITSDQMKVTTKGERKTWLGVLADDVGDEVRAQLPIAEGTGLLIRSVSPASPAAEAGVLKNDVLVKFDDQILTNADQLRALVGTKKEGDTVKLTYLRRGKEATADVKLGGREGGDERDGGLNLGKFLGTIDLKKITGPLNAAARALVLDKDGNVLTTNDAAGDLSEAVKALERTLKDSGVDQKVIEQTKRSLAETAEALRKAAGEIGNAKGEIREQVEKAVKEANKAVREAREAAERARKQAGPTNIPVVPQTAPVPPTSPVPIEATPRPVPRGTNIGG